MTNHIPGVIAPRLMNRLKAMKDDQEGSAALEFAMIAGPFFFLIFGLLEVCMIFIMSTVLEHAVSEASREVRTGQAQEAGIGQVAFRNSVCSELFGLLDCNANLHVDVQALGAGFGGAALDLPLDAAGNVDTGAMGFNPGGANEVVAVRAFYEWELVTPIMSAPLKNMADNKHLLQANAVFRNEPFED